MPGNKAQFCVNGEILNEFHNRLRLKLISEANKYEILLMFT